MTQRDSDSEVVTASCSDTESCVEEPTPQRRLRLLWDPSVPDPVFSGIRSPEWWKGCSAHWQPGSGRSQLVQIPRAVRSQRWSPINVPLIWSASGSADSAPALEWLIMAAGRIVEPINLYEGRMPARDAARTGWLALRQVLRAWHIEEPNHLTGWLRTQGFPGTNPGNHISARVQKFIIGEAIRADARVALLEGVYVQLAIHMGCELGVPQPHLTPSPPVVVGPRATAGFDWSLLDDFQIDEIFLFRVTMLKTCPHFMRSLLREAFQVALRERFRAKLMGDEEGQIRGWKLFAMEPMMLLHRPRGNGSVGRSELVHRADRFAAGRWTELVLEATQHQVSQAPRGERTEEADREHRGKAAQARVQRGQVPGRNSQVPSWHPRMSPL